MRGDFDARIVDAIASAELQHLYETHVGFGHAPKFPHSSSIDLLIYRYQATGDKSAAAWPSLILEGMALGGVYDQVGGGFHRYSVDERWCVPPLRENEPRYLDSLKNFLHGYQVDR